MKRYHLMWFWQVPSVGFFDPETERPLASRRQLCWHRRLDLGFGDQSLSKHYGVMVIKRDLEERNIDEIAQVKGYHEER